MCIKVEKPKNFKTANAPKYEPKSWRVIFQGIPGIVKPCTIEMKIPKARKPAAHGFTIDIEEHPFPKELL